MRTAADIFAFGPSRTDSEHNCREYAYAKATAHRRKSGREPTSGFTHLLFPFLSDLLMELKNERREKQAFSAPPPTRV